MPETPATTTKRERVETLLRILSVVILVASVVGSIFTQDHDRYTLAAAAALLVWIIISSTGARMGVGRLVLRSWWVIAVDLVLLAGGIWVGRPGVDELAALAMAVPIGIMTLRGRLVLSIILALVATGIAFLLVRESLGAPEGSQELTIESIAHTLAWLAVFGLVAFSSRAGYRFLQVADLQESEADVRLQTVLDRGQELAAIQERREAVERITAFAREVFDADTASVMKSTDQGATLVGLSGPQGYVDGSGPPPEQDASESLARVSIADFVAYQRRPLLLNADRANDPRFRNLSPRSGIRSAMCVPVLVGGRLLGVLNVTRLSELSPEFTQSDLRVAMVLAHFSAVALDPHDI